MSNGPFQFGGDTWPGTAKLLEEMGELQQVLGKLIMIGGLTRHWDGDLRPRLVEELADVQAALEFFVVHNLTTEERIQTGARVDEKLDLFQSWHQNATKP